MRWATFADRQGRERVGLAVGNALHAIEPGLRLVDLLGDEGQRLNEAGERVRSNPNEVFDVASVRLCAPVPTPPSVRDFYAFEQHVRTARQRRGLEMDPDWYELPVFYFANPAAIVGPFDDVAVPPCTAQLDYELEVAAVGGMGGAAPDPDQAARPIA